MAYLNYIFDRLNSNRFSLYSVAYIILHLSYNLTQRVQCSLIIQPQNVATVSGEAVTLSCASNSEDRVAWVAYSPGSPDREYISSGLDLSQSASQYISISQERIGHYTLHINTTRSAAKRYICVEPVSTAEASAEVIVFERNPECLTKVTDDFVNMSCSTRFAGNWAPTMEWRTQKGKKVAAELVSSPNNFVTTYLLLPMKLTMNDTAYKINVITKFNASGRPKETIAINVPEYNHTISPYSSGFEWITVTQTVEIREPGGVTIALSCLFAILFIATLTVLLIFIYKTLQRNSIPNAKRPGSANGDKLDL